MMTKFKAIVFGCCKQEPGEEVIDPVLQSKMKTYEEKRLETHLPTRGETQDTGNNYLATTEYDEASGKFHGNKTPKLKLVVKDGDILPANKEFVITTKGLDFGGRRKLDGCVFIGRQMLAKDSHIVINDIIIEDPSVGERHCMIKYNSTLRKYYIKDQGEGSGTFIKVETMTKLKNGYIISFSDSHMAVTVTNQRYQSDSLSEKYSENFQEADLKDCITLKLLDGPKAGQVFKFSPEDEVVKVGRMPDCQIKFEGSNLSRYQCTIKHVDGKWQIIDGTDDKPSTNGTWIFVENPFEITHGMLVKVGQTLMRAEIENQVILKTKTS